MTAPAWVEVQLAVGGALKLARGDPSGLGFFDTSIDGFWRSFRAGVICYPFFLFLLVFRVSAAHWAASGVPHIVIEVKGGHRAERSEPSDLDAWQAQTLNETRHANAKLGLLITKRVGHGVTRVGEWWAWLYLPHMVAMRGERPTPSVWVRLTVEDAFTWLDFAGLKAPHVKSA